MSSKIIKKSQGTDDNALAFIVYPDSGSNRDALRHWCLRPARLPIPPSGQDDGNKPLEDLIHTNVVQR